MKSVKNMEEFLIFLKINNKR